MATRFNVSVAKNYKQKEDVKNEKNYCIIACSNNDNGVLAACSKNTENDGKTVLTVGYWPAQKGEELDRMNKIKDEFEAKYPNIKINADTSTYDLQTLYPKAEAGTMPDVFGCALTEFQKLTDAGYVADITEGAKKSGYFDNINPLFRDFCSIDGKMYAFPTEAYAIGLYFNASLLEQAGYMNEDGTPKQPKDWYELAEMAKHIKEVTGIPGFVLETSGNNGGWLMTNIGWSFGVDWMEQDENGKWKATFDTKEAVDTLQFIKDLKWKYDCVPENNIINQEEAIKLYATGQAAMVLEGLLGRRIAKYEMNLDDFGAMAIPAGPARHVALLGGKLEFVYSKNASADIIDAAFKWYEFNGYTFKMDDQSKQFTEQEYQNNAKNGDAIGIHVLSPWSDDSENVKFRDEMLEKYCNIIPNHVKLYEDSLKNTEIEFQEEEPVCCQDLYGVLDNLIQEVYSNQNADCAALIKQANADFQKNYLDKLD